MSKKIEYPQYIYGLCDPFDDTIRYIGRSNDPNKRLSTHKLKPVSKEMHVWFQDVRARNAEPGIVILEKVTKQAKQAEEKWTAKALVKYPNLLNIQNVGESKNRPGVFISSFITKYNYETLKRLSYAKGIPLSTIISICVEGYIKNHSSDVQKEPPGIWEDMEL